MAMSKNALTMNEMEGDSGCGLAMGSSATEEGEADDDT
jgi:hypothetical protein